MYNVLHIMAGADAGGISSVVLNYYTYLDKTKYHFDIALTTNMVGQNAKAFKALGCKLFFLPLKSEGIKNFENELKKLLESNHYDAVHVHENQTSYIALRVAKQAGIKCRIAHSHTTSPTNNLKDEIRRVSGCVLNSFYATKLVACGDEAGKRVFGRLNMKKSKAVVLPNAIDCDKFKFNLEKRNEIRKELGVENDFVIGMVGRLSEEKNYLFALDFMRDVYKKNDSVKLLVAGNGDKESELKEFVSHNKMNNYVEFLGRRDDACDLYQGFDVLILPSLFEGFPVVAVEALMSGLPVLLSDTITKELDFSKNVKYISLKKEEWVKAVTSSKINLNRLSGVDEMIKHGFDIKSSVKVLEKIYS